MALADNVVVVTGASRGIGRAIARECAANGASLVLTARNVDALKATASECRELGAPEPFCITLDLADDAGVKSLFEQVHSRYGRLDGLVNNAGVMHEGLLGMISPADIARVLSVNVKAPLMTMQYAARIMARRNAGSIVNMASIMGTHGAAGLSLYSASKAALVGASLSAAKELASRGIRVNAVAPGFIDTDMTRNMPPKLRAARIDSIGVGRPGSPQEVARVVSFLLGSASGYVTGQVIGVDGLMSV